MENVAGPYRMEQHTPKTLMATQFMAKVFGKPVHHQPALCGDLVSRHAKWFSNMFTHEFYEAHEPLFRKEAWTSLSQLVRELSGGKLKPQVVCDKRQLQVGLNVLGEEARVLPKFVSSHSKVNQRLPCDGTPGAGMLEVVGSNPPRFVPCPINIRIAAQGFWP